MSSSDPRNWPEYVTYGVALILLAAALGVGYSFFVSADANSALDARLCPKQGAPPALLVVMVDTSDPLSIVQRKAVDNRLREAIEQSPDHTEIQLYTVGDITNTLLQPV